MTYPQALHLDVGPEPWCVNSNTRGYFSFSIIIGIEDFTYLDFVDKEEIKVNRICIKKGDVLAFRGDVPHGGTENACDHVHYRLHAYIDSGKLREDETSNNEETVPYLRLSHHPLKYNTAVKKWRPTELNHSPV